MQTGASEFLTSSTKMPAILTFFEDIDASLGCATATCATWPVQFRDVLEEIQRLACAVFVDFTGIEHVEHFGDVLEVRRDNLADMRI